MGWPKKMWGRKPTPKIKPEKPEFEDMGLFADTVRKLEEKEAELAVAYDRIRNLETALKAARADKFRAMGASGYTTRDATKGTPMHDLNSLSSDDVQKLFAMHDREKELKQPKTIMQRFGALLGVKR